MRRALLIAGAGLLAAGPASAHTFGAAGAGIAAGLAHPFAGLDHLLAMIAVGLWASQLGGRALWAVPASFVGAMILGGMAAMFGLPMPAVELGIAGSVLLLGLLVATRLGAPLPLAAAVVALFALFHGHAHGTELPEAASPAAYAAGFVVATALLHLAGVAIGRLDARIVRAAGAATACVGVGLLLL